jgi:hypothetical protein
VLCQIRIPFQKLFEFWNSPDFMYLQRHGVFLAHALFRTRSYVCCFPALDVLKTSTSSNEYVGVVANKYLVKAEIFWDEAKLKGVPGLDPEFRLLTSNALRDPPALPGKAAKV